MMKLKLKTLQFKVLCLAAGALLSLTACQSAGIGGGNANAPGGAADARANDPQSQTTLVNSMKNLQAASSWIAEVNSSSDAAPTAVVKMRIQYAAPDSYQIENDALGNKTQIVAVGGKTYLQAGGKWREVAGSVDLGNMIGSWKDMFSDDKLAAFKNIRSEGKETVDGKQLAVYAYEIDQQAAIPSKMKEEMTDEAKSEMAKVQSENRAKIWIDEAKNLPVRMDMTMTMTAPQQLTQQTSVKYIYDQEVKIEAPKLK